MSLNQGRPPDEPKSVSLLSQPLCSKNIRPIARWWARLPGRALPALEQARHAHRAAEHERRLRQATRLLNPWRDSTPHRCREARATDRVRDFQVRVRFRPLRRRSRRTAAEAAPTRQPIAEPVTFGPRSPTRPSPHSTNRALKLRRGFSKSTVVVWRTVPLTCLRASSEGGIGGVDRSFMATRLRCTSIARASVTGVSGTQRRRPRTVMRLTSNPPTRTA